ncbi:hypothetical protein TRFO_27627 [Tritrichomonas foetus]|uniref:RING-type domain-containing protein n=1 Tax=Tritrichomonas foetus TaxID=1144522 RepID=A0A1J4K1J8_9EUKA|nr:hypothetical protein TRFO_27627 [Tritrichomonas foetus]|eukprot:OHT04834.1 hypothetical protein TRFO_27627 [Tritrichomonas foetus]
MPAKRGRPKKSQNTSEKSQSESSESDSSLQNDADITALEILSRIRQKLEDIGDPAYKITKPLYPLAELENSSRDNFRENICICCLNKLKKGEIAAFTSCCGSISHISCLAVIAKSDNSSVAHICPSCMQPFSEEDLQKYKDIERIIELPNQINQTE